MPKKKQATFSDLNSDKNGRTAEEVSTRLQDMIRSGELRAGDKLPPERDLAKIMGISRPTLRAGIRSLITVGVLRSRQGAGTFVASSDGSPVLDVAPLQMLSVLHGFTPDEMFEARLALETSIAALAAERVDNEQITLLAEELAGMYASLTDPEQYLIHETRFHRTMAAASGNRVLTALTNMVAAILSESESTAAYRTIDLKQVAERHHNIFRALRDRDPQSASEAMRDHLIETQKAQRQEVQNSANNTSENQD